MKKILYILFLLLSGYCIAQTTEDYTIQVNTAVQTSPPKITFSWALDTSVVNYYIYRKTKTAQSWGSVIATLPGSATQWADTNLLLGDAYEYEIRKYGTPSGYNYLYSGVNTPSIDIRGKIILLVDSTFTDSLATEISQLTHDFICDGWQVIRHDISRTDSVPNVKSLILNDYHLDSINTKAIFVLGHVPVPYSGDINPDGHPDHLGAWPADVYYANMHGIWTDNSVNDAGASRVQNQNIPGDGKFDQSTIPSPNELQIGRVDFSNMPSFALSEQELLRNYLNKNHNYRFKNFNVRPRALVNDNFGVFSGEAFASCGWRISSLVSADSIWSLGYFSSLDTASYQWSYGCGGGTYTSAGGVGATTDFAANSVQTIFCMLFGSYFGDWDSQDNFLRAPLASGTSLTCSWAGRPYWFYHHMGLGENIGFSAITCQNNSGLYYYNYAANFVHIALMGDPTLRMHIIAPPSNLTATVSGLNSVLLSWNSAPDSILGYYMYRQDSITGFYNRISSNIIVGNSFTDNNVINYTNHYMVRAVRLETSASGTYYNLSEGTLDTIAVALGVNNIKSEIAHTSVYPNPSQGNFTIEFVALERGIATIEMYDSKNSLIQKQNISMTIGNNKIPINSNKFAPGVYFIKLSTNNSYKYLKVVIE